MDVWIGRDGERHGPYPESDIRQWLRSGEVSGADLGWYDGLADWQPLAVLFPDEVRGSAPPPLAAPTSPLPPPIDAVPQNNYASFWQRFGAWVIDLLILIVPNLIVFYALGGLDAYRHLMTQMQSGLDMAAVQQYVIATRPASIACVVIGFVYYSWFEASKWQATPGKRALKMRVTDLQDGRLSLGRSATRNAVRLTNLVIWLIPFVCYVAVAWTRRKQGLHDLLAHTLVVDGRVGEPRPISPRPSSTRGGSFHA